MGIDGLDRVMFENEECPLSGVVVEGLKYLSRRGDDARTRATVQVSARYQKRTRTLRGKSKKKAERPAKI
jgi:hypothetical protein